MASQTFDPTGFGGTGPPIYLDEDGRPAPRFLDAPRRAPVGPPGNPGLGAVPVDTDEGFLEAMRKSREQQEQQRPAPTTSALRKALTGFSGAEFYDPATNTVNLPAGFTQNQVIGAEAERRANLRKQETGYQDTKTLRELQRDMFGGGEFLTPRQRAESIQMQQGILGGRQRRAAGEAETELRRTSDASGYILAREKMARDDFARRNPPIQGRPIPAWEGSPDEAAFRNRPDIKKALITIGAEEGPPEAASPSVSPQAPEQPPSALQALVPLGVGIAAPYLLKKGVNVFRGGSKAAGSAGASAAGQLGLPYYPEAKQIGRSIPTPRK